MAWLDGRIVPQWESGIVHECSMVLCVGTGISRLSVAVPSGTRKVTHQARQWWSVESKKSGTTTLPSYHFTQVAKPNEPATVLRDEWNTA